MAKSSFTYEIYIRAPIKKVWDTYTSRLRMRQCWMGVEQECDWKKGSSWRLMIPDGRVADTGKIVEIIKNKKMVIAWQNQFIPKAKKEGISRMTLTLEQKGASTRLTILHEMKESNSFFIECIAQGWPIIMSSLKSLLETGKPLAETRSWPKGW